MRARPVWNRRLAEEWRECLLPISVLALKLIIACWVGVLYNTFCLGEVYYQEQVAKRLKNSLTHIAEPSGQVILRRPYHIGWFTNQVSMCVLCCRDILYSFLIRFFFFFRCLALWEGDRDLFRALELAKSFLAPTEVLNSLWPCQGTFSIHVSVIGFLRFPYSYTCMHCAHAPTAFHSRGKALRAKLSQACATAGIPPPLPPPTPDFAAAMHHHHHMGTTRAVTSR